MNNGMVLHIDSKRLQITPENFIRIIEKMNAYFERPMAAAHCFYTILPYWDVTSTVPVANQNKPNLLEVIGKKGRERSDEIEISPKYHDAFRKLVESYYVFTNEEAGIDIDYYFSHFDAVVSQIDPEYTKQHGIFFTEINLSKFALWFVHHYFEKRLSAKYIILDPAAGSGNLVTSWRKNHLKHKIVSELEPDLLKIIERRMKSDVVQTASGFTIVPKTYENRGLNFIDKPAEEYVEILEDALKEKNVKIDKPFAFLLNPPYKNTDENEDVRISTRAEYKLDNSIVEMAGEDASKERYLAFLSQIVNISKAQVKNHSDFKPIIMIFTPTSWLIPRPTYIRFRKEFDKHFKYESGFLIKSDEFFKLKGRWPLAFTIWSYYFNENGNKNALRLKDFTFLTKNDLAINWHAKLESVNRSLKAVLNKAAAIGFSNIREDIRLQLPFVKDRFGKNIRQTRYDFSTAKKEKEYGKLISGFPLKDEERHYKLQRKCGVVNGTFVGFMDDLTPVRVENDTLSRMSNQPERVWLQLRPTFIDINLTKIFNGPPDKYGYCVNDLESAKACFLWFAITKAVNGRYPIWANQFDIWSPKVKKARINYFYSLCFALGLAENRCVVTKFEKDNPVKGAPEVFVDNPLCPTNPESFWNKTLANEITSKPGLAKALVKEITDLYELWNKKYCKGQIIQNVGLEDEPYFKYFDYPDFVTPFSGLIQIKKYAEHNNGNDLTERLKRITEITKQVKNEIYTILVKDCKYFS